MKKFATTAEIKLSNKLIDQVIGQDRAVDIVKKAAKQHRNVLLIGSPGCLVADERVFLGNGAIAKIGTFGNYHLEAINESVMVGKGTKTAKATVFHSYKNQPIIEVITESGKSIKGTPNHPLLTVTKKYVGKRKIAHVKTKKEIEVDWYRPSQEWKRLDEIKVGDRVAVVSGVRCTISRYIETNFAPVKRNRYGPKFHGKLPRRVTPALGSLFGYIIGDGWVDSNRERIGFVVAHDEEDILPQLISFVKESFGIDPYIYTRSRAGRGMTMYYVEISNQDIYRNLHFLKEKRVPDLILRSGNEVAASFLRWLFTADGTVYNHGRGRSGVSLKSKNVELLRDVQMLLLRFGIESRINGFQSSSLSTVPALYITRGRDIIKFNKKIGFACRKKRNMADSLAVEAAMFARNRKQRSERVIKVIHGGIADVFDIEVPEGHRFIANGIISHNTGKTMLAQAMAELMPVTDLEDVLVYKNPNDENRPLVKTVKTYPKVELKPGEKPKPLGDGQGRQIVQREKLRGKMDTMQGRSSIVPITALIVILLLTIALSSFLSGYQILVFAALILGVLIFSSAVVFVSSFRRVGMFPGFFESNEPKLIVDNTGMTHAPFVDATGSRAGALLGDVKHDPLQCILPGEMILLENGNLMQIDRLVDPYFAEGKDGEIELGSNGVKVLGGFDQEFRLAPASVVRVYRRRYTGAVLKIRTRSGNCIRVTPNHPIALLDKNGRIGYSEAGDVVAGNRVVIPERISTGEGRSMNDEMIVFIADLLADGYMGERHIEFNLKRQFKIEQIKRDIERLGYVPKVKTRQDGATQIALNSAVFCRELRELGVIDNKEKRIPDALFSQEATKKILFLSRLLSLDGYVNKQGQFEILSSSKTYIQQIKALFLTLGINPKYHARIDRGYGKEKGAIQHVLRWNQFEWAKVYYASTINQTHKDNLGVYLRETGFGKECFDDIIPVNFSMLDGIRESLGVSKEKVHGDFWSLNPSVEGTRLTRNFLEKISTRFIELGANGEEVMRLKALSDGDYAFDEIEEIEEERYDGFVYNLTTESGNYFVDFVLTHNSGGLGTPAHLRVESGAVHRANKGVLFIDEIADLEPKSQQELLTAMQEKKYPITGQSELSSGAIVRTEPVPCDFLLVAAGNLADIERMHPALRSRIRGYGYEVYMESTMPDNEQNREKLVRFIAQEIAKDTRIPPFSYSACMEVINEARRRAGRKRRLTLILRDLGGLIRAAGDIAVERGKKIVGREEVLEALGYAKPIEAQYAEQELGYTRDYRVFSTKGYAIGKVNGLAVMGANPVTATGIVTPIAAEVTPASSRAEGKLIATGKLGTIAREAVKNISAVIKRHMHRDIASYDIHVQFIQTYAGVEGDSASISVAVSVISALEGIPVRQDVAMTGSLSVRGMVLPVGGITAKVRAAIEAGIKYVIIPESNKDDVYLDSAAGRKVRLLYAKNIADVLSYALKPSRRRNEIINELRRYLTADSRERPPLVVGATVPAAK
jgi:lon-related putative ATP-dependent protease